MFTFKSCPFKLKLVPFSRFQTIASESVEPETISTSFLTFNPRNHRTEFTRLVCLFNV